MQPNAREKRPATNVLAAIANAHWMITEDYLRTIIEVASRENATPEAVEARFGRPLDNTRAVTMRDGVATIPITGPMFRYADFFTRVSGATAYEDIARDLTAAVEDRSVRAILLAIDSPGGEVNGTQETAELIYQVRGVKPITAFVSGMGASAGYWLASAADEVLAGETAILGSIGVLFTHRDSRQRDEALGVRTLHIVSSQSPKKRLDPTEDEGRAAMQAVADQLADVFVNTVARNRGVSPETVLAEFGQGGVFVGAAAVTAGLADRLTTYEAAHAALAERSSIRTSLLTAGRALSPRTAHHAQESTMTTRSTASGAGTPAPAATTDAPAGSGTPAASNDTAAPPANAPAATATRESIEGDHPAIVAAIRTDAAATERARLLAIDELAQPGLEAVITACKADASCTAGDAALKVVAALKLRGPAAAEASAASRLLAGLAADEATLQKPSAAGQSDTGAQSATARITATYNAHRGTTTPAGRS